MEERRKEQLLISSCFAIPLPLITLAVAWNPSGAPPASPFGSPLVALTLALLLGVLAFGGLWVVLGATRAGRFVVAASTWLVLSVVASIALATLLHRDYYSHAFQLPLIAWFVVARRMDLFASPVHRERLYGYLRTFNIVVFVFTGVWIALMGYAISTRQEPRWAESIVYNIYNTLFIFLLAVTTVDLRIRGQRTVVVSEDNLHIDRYDFSGYFTGTAGVVVRAFLRSEGRTFTCREIATQAGEETESGPNSCVACLEARWKVTRCRHYRNIYNMTLDIRRVLETLEIGTIVSPQDRSRVKEDGWKLRLFANVRVVVR